MANHLKTAAKNATYTSKTTQNELIECIDDHIRDSIIHEIKQAKYYSILCDEVVDVSSKEQVSIVLRFVDNNCIIREEFLDFISTERITGEVLVHAIKELLNRFDLGIQNCRGQGYDGASNMSSARGVQGHLLDEILKLYIYTVTVMHLICV